jgi:hypothetical protein
MMACYIRRELDVPHKVSIKHNATGEIRIREYAEDWKDDEQQDDYFNWTEGNFSCDCNRHLEFLRAGGGEPNEDDGQMICGSSAYKVLHVELQNGQRIEIDG